LEPRDTKKKKKKEHCMMKNFYSSHDLWTGTVGEECSAHGEIRNEHTILVRKPRNKRLHGKPRHTSKDNKK